MKNIDSFKQPHVTNAFKDSFDKRKINKGLFLLSGTSDSELSDYVETLVRHLHCRANVTKKEKLSSDLCIIKCNSCAGSDFNFHKLDCSIHDHISDVRDLIAKLAYGLPGFTRIFLIKDPEHLTIGAVDALLSIFLNPPENAIFFLTTTQPHLIPIAIRRLTHHFEFNSNTFVFPACPTCKGRENYWEWNRPSAKYILRCSDCDSICKTLSPQEFLKYHIENN